MNNDDEWPGRSPHLKAGWARLRRARREKIPLLVEAEIERSQRMLERFFSFKDEEKPNE